MARFYSLTSLLAILLSDASAAPAPTSNDGYGQSPSIQSHTAEEIIEKLELIPNPEKGYFIETFKDPDATAVASNRSVSTAIYYLLEGAAGDSVWHRVDAAEVWHFYAGAPLVLSLSLDDGQAARQKTLGPDLFNGQQPQVVVAKREWQRARSLGDWTLVGTTGKIALQSHMYRVITLNSCVSCPGVC
jgi:uncharacterized protein